MLLILEVLFFIAGLWAIIFGKLPVGLFKFLFGKGEYLLSSDKTRLFGLFLLSPLPISFFISFLLTLLLGEKGAGYAVIFEIIYIFIVVITALFVAKKIRNPETEKAVTSQLSAPSQEQKINSYGLRLLIIFGIVILGFITITTGLSLVMVVISSVTVGTRWTGNFWSDIFPFILMITTILIGSFGTFKLVRILRN